MSNSSLFQFDVLTNINMWLDMD